MRLLWHSLVACALVWAASATTTQTQKTHGPSLAAGNTACDVSWGPKAPNCAKLWAVQAEVKTPPGPGVADTGNPTCSPESAQPNAMGEILNRGLGHH